MIFQNVRCLVRFLGFCTAILAASFTAANAAVFSGNSRIEIADTTGALSWNDTTNALTVSCWFKLSVPSDFVLSEDMAILVNRRSGTSADAHAFALYLSATTGNIEFSSRGSATEAPVKLIARPYLERWYHLAVVRSGSSLKAYVDGREVASVTTNVGDSRSTDGVSIGGWGNAKYLRGEVQEVAIYPAAIGEEYIAQYLFADLPIGSFGPLEPNGYFKLAYSATPSDQLKNFALAPPTGTNPALAQGSGVIGFDAVDKSGEQSRFDAQRNNGRDATTPLSGEFSWQHSVFNRATPGIPFAFEIGYSSGNAFNANNVGSFNPFADSVLGSGWRHTFDTRIIPSNYFSPISGTDVFGLMLWNGSLDVWEDLALTGNYTTRHRQYRGEFNPSFSGTYEWVTPERLIYKFKNPSAGLPTIMRGRLLQIRDFNGNALNLTWDTVLGRITKVTDTSGGEWSFIYLPTGRLDKITGLGWTTTFTYDAQNRLSTKTLTYSGTSSYAPVSSTQWQFFYNAQGLLERIVDPRVRNQTQITYDTYGRKLTTRDAHDRTTQFDYNKPGLRQLTTTALHGTDATLNRVTVDTFDRKLHLLSHIDPLGYTSSFKYDDFSNVTEATDARSIRTVMTYDARANVTSRTNGLGETTRWIYDKLLSDGTTTLNKPTKETRPVTAEAPTGWENRYDYDGAGNLLFHRDGPVGGADFGTLAAHLYDSRGLVTSSKDAKGNETRFTYDPANGFLASRTLAYGTPQAATWTITSRTELGWPLTETNPLSQTTTLGYNLNGQVVSTTDAINRTFTKDYDANGNLLSESDGKGVLTTYRYNDVNELFEKRARPLAPGTDGFLWNYTYTRFGEPETTTAPEALSDGVLRRESTTRVYDKNGRLVEVRDSYYDSATPSLHRIAYEYDANGNQTAVIDKIGQRTERTYDALGRVVAERDPLGNIRRTAFDAAGRVSVITSPNGSVSSHAYDGRGRLTQWTDPEGFVWVYAYDGVGNIEKITDALGGEYIMTYGPRNERLTEKNQDNQTWTYTYDALVRLETQVNPPGTGAGPGGGPVTRTITYDDVGRIDYIEFNTGRTDDFSFDNNNNLTSIARTRSGQPPTTFNLVYDALDRLTETRDTFNQTVTHDYDALGRATRKRYPGGKDLTQSYDRLGRLKKLSFAYSATPFECSFTYDDADRLTDRTYPNGITQTNTFDEAGRLKTLDYAGSASPPIALAYAYDRNGNKTSGSEAGTLAWKDSSLADYDDTSAFTAAGKLETRTDAAAPGGPRSFTYTYDDNGNLTQASASGESYALGYDEDNRTTSITWDTGVTSKQILNRYDGLGRRVSRTLDGAETRYVLDLVGGMERILCDTDATGAIQAWYIHGPDLSFRVSSSGALTCYHADAMGNIVRTTNATGATRNQYAYTPYGRTILVTGTTPDADDPYRFVGSQGVMLELPGLYFMRARYYSADAGVFFATDPVKNIGAKWTSQSYSYSANDPLGGIDPLGLFVIKGGFDLGGGGSLFGMMGADAGISVGLIFETDALFAGDISNAIGFYGTVQASGNMGLEPEAFKGAYVKGNAGPSIQVGSSGYGVRSVSGFKTEKEMSVFAGPVSYSADRDSWSVSLKSGGGAGVGTSQTAKATGVISAGQVGSVLLDALGLTPTSGAKTRSQSTVNGAVNAAEHSDSLRAQSTKQISVGIQPTTPPIIQNTAKSAGVTPGSSTTNSTKSSGLTVAKVLSNLAKFFGGKK